MDMIWHQESYNLGKIDINNQTFYSCTVKNITFIIKLKPCIKGQYLIFLPLIIKLLVCNIPVT